MPASFPEILNSRIFKFVIGEEIDGTATEFFVHEEAIAQLSKPLHSMMKGGMLESQVGCTKWGDVSKETFERFVQFAYTGDYSVPVGVKRKARARTGKKGWEIENEVVNASFGTPIEMDDETQPVEVPPEDSWGLAWTNSISKKSKKEKKGSSSKKAAFSFKLPTDFNSFCFSHNLSPSNNYVDTCEPSTVFDPELNYTSIFLAHAALYILADYRIIDSLKARALYKLHKTLSTFQLNESNAEDVVNLARYVYEQEEGVDGLVGGDGLVGDLRALVCTYLAMNAKVLALDEEFMELLGKGGQFVKDFFWFELRRVVD
ncbi:hypothetical protein ACMFMG_009608 [Clarireedia jacksonii]